MKPFCYFAFSVLFFALLSGCATTPSKNFAQHAITIDGDGDIRMPNMAGNGFTTINNGQNTEYIKTLFHEVAQSGNKKKILIFVHGGLNTLKTSTDRVNKLIGLYQTPRAREQELESYPILINWDSGFFETYGEHLCCIRQGEENKLVALPTSPFYFIADAGRGIVRAPIDFAYTGIRDIQSIPIPGWDKTINKYRKNTDELYKTLKESSYPNNISLGQDNHWGLQSLYKVPVNIITFIPQLVSAPFIDGFGSPAWEGMQRRTKVLFNKPEEFDIDRDGSRAASALKGEPTAVMETFAKQLFDYQQKHQDTEITIVGHSMGTFIINELVRRHPEIHYRNIVYMAGADSIRNTFSSVLPYLQSHDTRFFNLVLHPQNEIEEPNYYFLPRGSLLVWIDDLFSLPHTQFDRTVGRWENLIQAYGAIPEDIRDRVFIKAFDQDSSIKMHGDFGDFEKSQAYFWKEEFWKPKSEDRLTITKLNSQ